MSQKVGGSGTDVGGFPRPNAPGAAEKMEIPFGIFEMETVGGSPRFAVPLS